MGFDGYQCVGKRLRDVLLPGMVLALIFHSAAGFALEASPAAAAPSAQTATNADASLKIEDIQKLRDAVSARSDLPDAVKQEILSNFDKAIDSLKQAAALAEAIGRFERERVSAPSELEVAKADAAQPIDTKIDVETARTLEQSRQLRDQADANLSLAQKKVKELDDEAARRASRRTAIPDQIAKAQQESDDVDHALLALAGQQQPGNELPDQVAARRIELQAHRQRLEQLIASLGKELASYDARTELLQAQRDQAARRVTALERIAQQWRDLVILREKQVAAEEAAKARAAAADSHQAVKSIAQQNVALLERLSGNAATGTGILAKKAQTEKQLESFTKRMQALQDRLDRELRANKTANLTDVIDMRLRRARAELPNLKAHKASLAARRAEIAEVQQQLADIEYQRDLLPDLETRKRVILQELDPAMSAENRAEIERRVTEQLTKQQEIYDSLIRSYTDFSEVLLKAQTAEAGLVAVTEEFKAYIDERILWLRSMPAVGQNDLVQAWQSCKWLSGPSKWIELGRGLWVDAQTNPQIFASWIMLFLVLFILKRRLSDQLRVIAELVPKVYTDRFSHTLLALFITVLLAAFWPGVVWFVAWRIATFGGESQSAESQFAKAAAAGLSRAATILLLLQFHRHLCKRNGLGEVHFRWRESSLRLLRRSLLRLTAVTVPLAFVIAADEVINNDPGSGSLGRLAFMAGMIAVTVFAAAVLNPRLGILDAALNRNRNGWLFRLRHLLYILIVGLPLALAATAAVGYYYTALQLERRLVNTFWLVLVLITFHGIVLRWLMIARRRLAIEEARKRRVTQADSGTAAPGMTADGPIILDEPKIDLNAINSQTRQLLRSTVAFALVLGIWFVWIDMLPALGMLKRVELYPQFGTIIDVQPQADQAISNPLSAPSAPSATSTDFRVPNPPAANPNTAEPRHIVTLSDLMLAIVIIIVTVVVSRNIPGLLEITLLQRLPFEPSGRYAFSTIVRYVLSIFGIIFAFSAVGIGWTQVQWLAAAISLGIGFGLQEIFANFISGIILLFEQPIRVGDTVTVNGADGTVTRIRMRATTITDADRKEIIIPNKEFITGQIVNWTLSDTTHRVVFPVGVAYDSDTALVEQTLLRIARENPMVMADPPPHVVFSKFGESTLDFSLRVFIPNLENALRVRHELNTAINEAFRTAGIDFSFPQRDIHIRSIGGPPLPPAIEEDRLPGQRV